MSIYVFRTETATLYIRAHVSPGVNTQFPVLITRPTGVLYLQILHPHLFIKADILARKKKNRNSQEFLFFFFRISTRIEATLKSGPHRHRWSGCPQTENILKYVLAP